MKTLIFLLLFGCQSFAQVYLAFVEVKDKNGQIIQYEPQGQFMHMAISYKGYWLHSYPPHGVSLTTLQELQKLGTVTIMPLMDVKPLRQQDIQKFVGKPFDYDFPWDDSKIYCAELIAKILGIRPSPMDFSAPVWPARYKRLQGQLGISPDDIFDHFTGKKRTLSCRDRLLPRL